MLRDLGAASIGNAGAPRSSGPLSCQPQPRRTTHRPKLWSTAGVLGSFLKLAAAWAAKHHVDFQVTHLAGEKNVWADALSRHRTNERCRFPLQSFLDPQGCVTLHPAGAAWPDEIRAAQHPQGEKEPLLMHSPWQTHQNGFAFA